VPIAKVAFVIAACTGTCLLATKAEYAGNPFLLIKFPAIALALLNVALLELLGCLETTPHSRAFAA
jgi:hypothetical protein